MATQWLRRAWLLAASCALALLLASCGGGTIVSGLTPTRVIAFGDAMGDVGIPNAALGETGQTGARYTVNDNSTNNWTLFVAAAYGRTLTPVSAGGLSYAVGNARVTAKPDAAGVASTPTVQEQIETFLASNTINPDDLILVSAGTSDVIVQAQAVLAGQITEDQALVNVDQAGRELAALVRRLVDAGAKHVVVAGPYNLGRSPWANETGQGGMMQRLSSASGNTGTNQPRSFNQRLLVSMVDLGADVLYVDAALEFNLYTGNPSQFALLDVVHPVCISVDAGAGIGTGTGQVNSKLCTPSTVAAGANYPQFLFADRVYPTPRGHQLFGDFAFGRIHERW